MKIVTFIFYLLYYGFARHLPRSSTPIVGKISKRIRGWTAAPLFAQSGSDINIEHGADFGGGKNIHIGDRSAISVCCTVPDDIRIGNDVMMGPHVTILGRHHRHDRTDISMMDQAYVYGPPVELGNDIWIGTRAILMPGIKVGDGAIIGAGAIVTKDVPPYAIVAGNPARMIRSRLDEQAQTEE